MLAGTDDWVWSTNELTELIGSEPIAQERYHYDETMKEFIEIVQQADTHHEEVIQRKQPTYTCLVDTIGSCCRFSDYCLFVLPNEPVV